MSQVPVPPGSVHSFSSLAAPNRPTLINPHLSHALGIPSNQATPILRGFRPYQAQPSSTSEENRKKSITRKNANKPRKKSQALRPHDELPAFDSIDTLSVLLFPLNVRAICLLQSPIHISLIYIQICELPSSLEHLTENPAFNLDLGSFGSFTQRMFDIGLVFNIHFTEDELQQLPSWRLFDRKIMDGVSALPARIQLPSRPSYMPVSANATLWTFVKLFTKTLRNQYGRQMYHLVPPSAPPITKWTLNLLIEEFAVPNPISAPDDAPVPQNLIIIGLWSQFSSEKYPYSTFTSPSFPWVCYRPFVQHRRFCQDSYQYQSLWLPCMFWISCPGTIVQKPHPLL